MTEKVWDKEIEVPEKWIQFVDDNVSISDFSLADSPSRRTAQLIQTR